MILRRGIFGLLVFCAGGCGSYALKEPQPPHRDDVDPSALQALVRKHCEPFVADAKSVGLGVAIIAPSGEVVATFGKPAIGSAAELTRDSVFEIGSMTKTFTATALAREIVRGAVRLDQPIAELLPDGMTLPESARSVTVQQLTTHTSGFPRLPDRCLSPGGLAKALFGGNPYSDYSEAQFRDDVADVELESTPGSTFSYSNFGVGLLGYVLAKRAGLDYEAYIRREVLAPLGMNDTAITLSADQKKRFVQGYTSVSSMGKLLQSHKSAPWDLPNWLAGAGALRSTPADMLIYLKAQMQPSTEMRGAIMRSHRELFRDDNGNCVAMNWFKTQNTRMNKTIVWHNGATGGFHSYIGFTLDGRVGVVVLANVGDAPVETLGVELLEELSPAGPATTSASH